MVDTATRYAAGGLHDPCVPTSGAIDVALCRDFGSCHVERRGVLADVWYCAGRR